MRAIIFLLVLVCSPAMADLVARHEDNELRLMNSPCVHAGILGLIKPEHRSKFRKASAYVGASLHYACWLDASDGAYLLIWEDGTATGYPVSAFIDEPGT